MRVIATTSGLGLADLLSDVEEDRAAIWVSGLEELTAESEELANYAEAVGEASDDDSICSPCMAGSLASSCRTLASPVLLMASGSGNTASGWSCLRRGHRLRGITFPSCTATYSPMRLHSFILPIGA